MNDSVYVDPLMATLMSRNWRHAKGCHLFVGVDTPLQSLHDFAASIGLKRCWFQHKRGKLPHYDLTEGKRHIAVAAGAVQLNRKDAVAIFREYRNK